MVGSRAEQQADDRDLAHWTVSLQERRVSGRGTIPASRPDAPGPAGQDRTRIVRWVAMAQRGTKSGKA